LELLLRLREADEDERAPADERLGARKVLPLDRETFDRDGAL